MRVDIAIAGASHTGLVMAFALDHLGGGDIAIALLDPRADPLGRSGAEAPASDPRAFALSAASQRLLDRVGVWPMLRDVAQPVHRIEITDSSLDDASRPVLLAYDNTLSTGETASWIVPGHALLEAVRARLVARPRAPRVIRERLVARTVTPHGIELALAGGGSLTASLAIAADGARSTLRDLAGIKVVRHDHGQTGIVTAVTLEHPHDGVAVQHFLPGGPFAILPMVGLRACITWSEAADEAAAILALDDGGFASEVDRRFGPRLGVVTPIGPRGRFPLVTQIAREMTVARTALVGDAAHAVHPIAGQGLNLALRDVAALAECVVEGMAVGQDPGEDTILTRYGQWRRFDNAVSAAGFGSINALFANDGPMLRVVRDAGLGVVDRMDGVKRMLVAEAAGTTGTLPRLLAPL